MLLLLNKATVDLLIGTQETALSDLSYLILHPPCLTNQFGIRGLAPMAKGPDLGTIRFYSYFLKENLNNLFLDMDILDIPIEAQNPIPSLINIKAKANADCGD